MAKTPRTRIASRKNPPIRVNDRPARTEQGGLTTLSPGMRRVAQTMQYAMSSGGQKAASTDTNAASMNALPKRNHRLRSWYLQILRQDRKSTRLNSSHLGISY